MRLVLRDIDDNFRQVVTDIVRRGFDLASIKANGHCHTKGMVVDDFAAVIGSHNWSPTGTTTNRDASLIVYDARVVDYSRISSKRTGGGRRRYGSGRTCRRSCLPIRPSPLPRPAWCGCRFGSGSGTRPPGASAEHWAREHDILKRLRVSGLSARTTLLSPTS